MTRHRRPARRRRLAVAAAAAGLMGLTGLAGLTGCSSASPVGAPPVVPQLKAALTHWSAFPAGAAARPLVVEAGRGVTGPSKFASAGDENAFAAGAISLPRSLPAAPASQSGFPLASARVAAAALTAGQPTGSQSPGQSAAPSGPSSGAPSAAPSVSGQLTVTGVRLGTGLFSTDRGTEALPAWQFSFAGVSGTANVLAVAASDRFWPSGLGQVTTHLSATQPSRNGRVLSLAFKGAEPGTQPCQASYSVRQQSSSHVVAVFVVGVQHGSAQACTAAGYPVTLLVTLPAALGNRVLVDASTFAPIPVTRSLVSSS